MKRISGTQSRLDVRGFTLVELMVGLAVGLFVSLAAISVFVSTRTLQSVSSSGTRMSENARLAMELLQRDFRSAGFQGCKSLLADPPVNMLVAGNGIFLDSGSSGLGGSHGNGATFNPVLNATLAALVPNLDSDVISVRVPVEPLSLGLSTPMTLSAGVPQVGASTPGNTIERGDIVLIANCKASAMFQVTAATPTVISTGALEHVAHLAGADPGNAVEDFGHVFRGDTAVYRLQTRHYYIAPGSHANTNSMWRFTFPNPAGATNPQEVAQGIDRMLVTYGLDNNDQTVNRYVSADSVASWDRVISARIQFLSTTVKDGVTLSPQAASFAGGTVLATDRRLRSQVTEVVTLRNRAP